VSGNDANAAAQKELRLAISDTATKTAADNRIFSAYCHIRLFTAIIQINDSTPLLDS
jgi:hypothetical protein